MESKNNNRINCFHCIHFFITWEPELPRGCKLFGFKTAQMPSVAVFNYSGVKCEGFKRKVSGMTGMDG